MTIKKKKAVKKVKKGSAPKKAKVNKNSVAYLMKQPVTFNVLKKILKLKPNGVRIFYTKTGPSPLTVHMVRDRQAVVSHNKERVFIIESDDLFSNLSFAKIEFPKSELNEDAGQSDYDEDMEADAIGDDEEFELDGFEDVDDLPEDAVVVDGPQLN